MKILFFIFIILASTTYRCDKRNIIDCELAAQDMIGEWEGLLNYKGPSAANGKNHIQTLVIESSNGCSFLGFTIYNETNNMFKVTGTIDEYGWVRYTEEEFIVDGGEYQDCLTRTNSNALCLEWPDLRWKEGTQFEDAKFQRNPYVLNGNFTRRNSFESINQANTLIGKFTTTKK